MLHIASIGYNMVSKYLWLAPVLLVALPGYGSEGTGTADLEGTSDNGYTLKIFSLLSPIQINQIHSWQIVVSDATGRPVTDAEITLSGGMPEHDHGLPTQPQITRETEPGSYLLEGMRFHMPGKWEIVIAVTVAGQEHHSTIEFQL
jgi:hypothetical protein